MGSKDAGKARKRRHARVRMKVSGTAERPRLCIFRSLNHIYAQVIDDTQGHTVASVSSLDPGIRSESDGQKKVATAAVVGGLVAKQAVERGVTRVVLDRGGYKYHGRVKALAEAAREGGLEF